MITSQHALAGLCVLANVLGTQMGFAGVKRLQEMHSIPFWHREGLYNIMIAFGPAPPDWFVLAWAYARVPIALAGVTLPLLAGLFLIPRGRLIQGWMLLSTSVLAFAGGGVWIWCHAVFNAQSLSQR